MKIRNLLKYLKCFGIRLTLLYYIPWYAKNNSKLSIRLFSLKHKRINHFIISNYKDILDKYKRDSGNISHIEKDCPIWILWWQGIENAPEIVKNCINSIERNKEDHKVILLDSNNITDYIEIPKYILDKKESGIIKMAMFSDIIRFSLLSKYGGIWCDATLFLKSKFNESMYNCSFYGIHLKNTKELYVQCTEGKWSMYFIGASRDEIIPKICREILLKYWEEKDELVDYFFSDYVIKACYNYIPSVKNTIDKIPFNNEKCNQFMDVIFEKYDENIWNEYKDTDILKLSWKIDNDKKEITENFYNTIINKYGVKE